MTGAPTPGITSAHSKSNRARAKEPTKERGSNQTSLTGKHVPHCIRIHKRAPDGMHEKFPSPAHFMQTRRRTAYIREETRLGTYTRRAPAGKFTRPDSKLLALCPSGEGSNVPRLSPRVCVSIFRAAVAMIYDESAGGRLVVGSTTLLGAENECYGCERVH